MNAKDIVLKHTWTAPCHICRAIVVLELTNLNRLKHAFHAGTFLTCPRCQELIIVYKRDQPGRHQG